MKKHIVRLLPLLFAGLAGLLPEGGAFSPQDPRPDQAVLALGRRDASLPLTLDPEQFRERPSAYVTYVLAGRIRPVLAKEPCFCPCHFLIGHRSLLDCFVGTHGKGCVICQQEIILCYEETKSGKSPRRIHKDLQAGKWSSIEVENYARNFLAAASAGEAEQ
jgi:hypothetical protein